MQKTKRFIVYLFVTGKDLIPNDVTRIIGVEPTESKTAEESFRKKMGKWSYRILGDWGEKLEDSISELINKLNLDIKKVQQLKVKHNCYISVFIEYVDELACMTIKISPMLSKCLAQLELELELFTYFKCGAHEDTSGPGASATEER